MGASWLADRPYIIRHGALRVEVIYNIYGTLGKASHKESAAFVGLRTVEHDPSNRNTDDVPNHACAQNWANRSAD